MDDAFNRAIAHPTSEERIENLVLIIEEKKKKLTIFVF
jgi:hypothetical protein